MFSSLIPPPKVLGKQLPKIAPYRKLKKSNTSSKGPTLLEFTKHASRQPDAQVVRAESASTIAKLHLNEDGSLNYSQTIASAVARPERAIHASFEDTIPLKKRYPNLKHHFPRPSLEQTAECVRETQAVIKEFLDKALGVLRSESKETVSFVQYESSSLVDDDEQPRGRTFAIRDIQEDPMLPPKHKLRKNRRKEPSPPPPVLKRAGSAVPLSKEEKDKWNIPAAISNWKNNQGFTISLDKRMVASNQNHRATEEMLNVDKFGSLSQALEDADRQAREDIGIRNNMLREKALREKEEQELKIRELVELSRAERNKRGGDIDNKSGFDASKKRRY